MANDLSGASYLAQLRRLRNLATNAMARYPVKVRAIHFIHHGENTTFQVQARDGRKYLLRIHRNDYHTQEGIQEELSWLALLAKTSLDVPKPLLSKNGNYLESITHPSAPLSRNCSVFKWMEGRMIGKTVAPKHMYQVGALLANLQLHTPRKPVAHRRYWDSEGLVGVKPKFSSIDKLADVSRKQQEIITRARKLVFKKLRSFEKKFPERMGLIHADLHFGNILKIGSGLGAIDFDDCGYGFHAYDLAIPLYSVEHILSEKQQKRIPEYKEALIAGYTSKKTWDRSDEELFPYLLSARRLCMLGWLNSRSDNP